jgi:hypothetical protein
MCLIRLSLAVYSRSRARLSSRLIPNTSLFSPSLFSPRLVKPLLGELARSEGDGFRGLKAALSIDGRKTGSRWRELPRVKRRVPNLASASRGGSALGETPRRAGLETDFASLAGAFLAVDLV